MTIETLEDYLAGEYHQDIDDIRALEETLERTANVFIYAQHDKGAWPYSYRQSDNRDFQDRVSHGTQAMIAVALARITGEGRLASGQYARLKLREADDVRASYWLGTERLAQAVPGGLRSRSFGTDDPVTLSHVIDLLDAASNSGPTIQSIHTAVSAAVDELKTVAEFDPRSAVAETNPKAALLRNLPGVFSLFKGEKFKSEFKTTPELLSNAFVPLRIARSIFALADLEQKDPPKDFKKAYRRFFETGLHEQLSFSEIPDSRFDPAQLIFCLEGLMLISPSAVDDRLFERVLDVLEAKQEESAHWRPNRPIYATQQGMTMLPVSVEGAVSLMRSISIKDRHKDFQPLSIRAIPMARRFWKWLQARSVRFEREFSGIAAHQPDARRAANVEAKVRSGKRELTGWHSEHVNDPGLIHLWDTSQVAEFMLAYRELLERGIAGRTLRLSRLKINRPARERPSDWADKWQRSVRDFDPLLGRAEADQIYYQIGKTFVEPWGTAKEGKQSSMLLFGPPGTGKSTVGENIADTLGMRMITVTVSDFLGRGGAYVEARAKAIFQTLEAQFESVILFDEIDAFLLDRDSERYDKQDTLFQFLTPGMLTKINDLHKLGRSIFIIATNYANRIDPAIQRRGRIDQHYLLQLPDRERRKAILKKEMALDDTAAVSDDLWKNTTFYGYSDVRSAVVDAGGKTAKEDAVLRVITDPKRTPLTVASYLKRIRKKADGSLDWDDFPVNEFDGLYRLWQEANGDGTLSKLLARFGNAAPIVEEEKFEEELRKRMQDNGLA